MPDESLQQAQYAALVEAALAEDLGAGDFTTECTVPPGRAAVATLVAKAPGVLAGRAVAAYAFACLDSACRVEGVLDGACLAAGEQALRISGSARAILGAERVALNFLQRLSGIATLTARYVDAIAGTGAVISDTRKTTPLWRTLEKYAVRCGGGTNHRARLDAMLLVKENHITAAGGLEPALRQALAFAAPRQLEVEIEVRTFAEFEAALALGPQRILLDHWQPEAVGEAVARRGRGREPRLEVSGNLTLTTVRDYAMQGADILSVGALTHSAPALDLSLLVESTS